MNDELRRRVVAALRGRLTVAEPLARHTSLGVGGPADLFAEPADRADLAALIELLQVEGVPWLVIGGGYNLLVRDGGFRGVAITLRRLDRIEAAGAERVRVEAGASNRALVEFTRQRNLAGLEFLTGIPGSVGGALAMNAGAHGGTVLERVTRLTTLRAGVLTDTPREELVYGYRLLELAPGEIIVAAEFGLETAERAAIDARLAACREHRAGAQPVGFPSAGSWFRNPPGEAAWRLIEAAGLRGHQIGGAQVSEVHTNFLVNRGGATARDFLDLAALVQERVRATSGIELAEEVRIVGEEIGE